MNQKVQKFLLAMGDGGDSADEVGRHWADPSEAWENLAEAFREESLGEDNDDVLAMLRKGVVALGPSILPRLYGWFFSAELPVKTNLTLVFAEFGPAAGEVAWALAATLANNVSMERYALRNGAAYALGKLGVATPMVVNVLAKVAGSQEENQPLRSICMEALMDLGPPASAADLTLLRVLREDEDQDLKQFARSALRVIRGQFTAEQMRSSYRAIRQSELDRLDSAE